MGIYYYHLTTKSRKVFMGPDSMEKQDFFLLKFAGKMGHSMGFRNDRIDTVREARAEHILDAWHRRIKPIKLNQGEQERSPQEAEGYPQYIVSNFSDGSTVYTNWPSPAIGGEGLPVVEMTDSSRFADVAGYLRKRGSRFYFEKWHTQVGYFKSKEESRAAIESIRNLNLTGGYLYDYDIDRPIPQDTPYLVRFTYQLETDGVAIKFVLS